MLNIRPENATDIATIHAVNKAAFGRAAEADLVDALRHRGALLISLVADSDGQIVGHIAFSGVTVKSETLAFAAMDLGPVAVLPDFQRQGIGGRLIRAGLDECGLLGHQIVVLVGHPGYYPRFGFGPARARGLECEFEVPDEAWMVLETRSDALAGRTGTVFFQPEFRNAT